MEILYGILPTCLVFFSFEYLLSEFNSSLHLMHFLGLSVLSIEALEAPKITSGWKIGFFFFLQPNFIGPGIWDELLIFELFYLKDIYD